MSESKLRDKEIRSARTCKTCLYWGPPIEPGVDPKKNGTCRREPPGVSMIPVQKPGATIRVPDRANPSIGIQVINIIKQTAADWWCGEHPLRGPSLIELSSPPGGVHYEPATRIGKGTVIGLYAKIPDDEPICVLRGQDVLASASVDLWASDAETAKVNPEKVAGARAIAEAMRAWKPQRLPD